MLSIYFLFSYSNLIIDSENHNDQIRFEQTRQVFERIDISTIFLGHGLGVGIPIRKLHMEDSFLEIFHKQGLIGLAFWGYLLITSFLNFEKIGKQQKKNAFPYMVSIVIIYIQSFFNPFVNNPIGMSFVLISFIIILKGRKTHENKCLYGNI